MCVNIYRFLMNHKYRKKSLFSILNFTCALINADNLFAEIVIERGLDIFGQVPIKAKQVECVCPNCSRNLAASRFAPHLEKCMGMGRTSSRVASRRLVSFLKA